MVARYLEALEAFLGETAYVDGQIFMTWTPAGLALKLPERWPGGLLLADPGATFLGQEGDDLVH